MAWLYLALAAAFEILFALSMKASKGFTVLWPTVTTVIGVIAGITFLTLSTKSLPVSIAYPIWVGVGAMGTVAFGYWLFGEPLTPLKLASIALIALGVAGLKVGSGG
jgi:quaternary ammonium compound-resistance protein SugE